MHGIKLFHVILLSATLFYRSNISSICSYFELNTTWKFFLGEIILNQKGHKGFKKIVKRIQFHLHSYVYYIVKTL